MAFNFTLTNTGGTRGGSGITMGSVFHFTGGVTTTLDVSLFTTQTASSIAAQTTGSVTTTVNGDAVVGALISSGGSLASTTAGAGFTLGNKITGASPQYIDEQEIQSSLGSINPAFGTYPTGQFAAGATAAFKKASGTLSLSQKANSPAAAGATNVSVNITSNPAGGDLLVAIIASGTWSTNPTGGSVTDDLGNGYTSVGGNFYVAGNVTIQIFYAIVTSGIPNSLMLTGCGT